MSLINDKLGADESLLEVLYHFLEQDPPLNPLLASFFSKTIGNLIARKTEQVHWRTSDQNRSVCVYCISENKDVKGHVFFVVSPR